MALRWCDSFDHYTTIGQKYDSVGGSVSFVTGRFGNGLRVTDGNQPGFAYKYLGAGHATWIVGFAFNLNADAGASKDIFYLLDGTSIQVYLQYETGTRRIRLLNGSGALLGTGTTGMVTGVWYYVELKVTIGNSAQPYEVRINENVEITGTGDTQNTANASANGIELASGSSNVTSRARDFDDLYVCDGSGSTNNNYLGDIRVECLMPNGNGATSNFVGSDSNSTDNYLLVDEVPPNDDTDYVVGTSVGDKDTYAYGDLTTTAGTVFGIQMCPRHRKADAGGRTVKTVTRLSGGTEEDGASMIVFDSYLYDYSIRETKPGGGAWSVSDINGAQFGMKVNT
jgi:hypothetical protein